MLKACLTLVALLALCAPAYADPLWLTPVPISAPASAELSGMHVAVAANGTAIAVWARAGVVQASTRAPRAGWSAPADLSGPGAEAPQVRVDARGDALVIWSEDRPGGAVIRARTRPAGGAFSDATDLSIGGTGANPRAASNASIAMNASGAAAVVWQRSDNADSIVQAVVRDRAGDRFGVPEQISIAPADTPGVGIDARGDVAAIWEGDVISAAIRPAEGSWRAPADLTPTRGFSPSIAVSDSGTALALWAKVSTLGSLSSSTRSLASGDAGGWSTAAPNGGRSYYGGYSTDFDADGNVVMLYADEIDDSYTLVLAVGVPGQPLRSSPFVVTGTHGQSGLARGFAGGAMAFWQRPGYDGWWAAVRATGDTLGDPEQIAIGAKVGAGLDVGGDDQGDAIAVWQQQDAGGFTVWAADYDGAPPSIDELSVPETITVGDRATLHAVATDRVSGASVTWDFGDGHAADGAEVSHIYTRPGARTVAVTATDAAGNETTVTRVISVVTPPPPAPRPVIDADGDGISPPTDCNDASAAIKPGATEIVGNAVDENCDGRVEPYPLVAASPALTALPLAHHATRLLKLAVRDLVAGDAVELKCSGRGCAKAMNRSFAIRKATKSYVLTRYVKGARLQPGARLEIRVSHAARIARIFTYVMRAGGTGAPRLSRACQPPGGKAKAC